MRIYKPIDRESANTFIGEKALQLSRALEKWVADEMPDKAFAEKIRLLERQMVDVSTRLLNDEDFWLDEGSAEVDHE